MYAITLYIAQSPCAATQRISMLTCKQKRQIPAIFDMEQMAIYIYLHLRHPATQTQQTSTKCSIGVTGLATRIKYQLDDHVYTVGLPIGKRRPIIIIWGCQVVTWTLVSWAAIIWIPTLNWKVIIPHELYLYNNLSTELAARNMAHQQRHFFKVGV